MRSSGKHRTSGSSKLYKKRQLEIRSSDEDESSDVLGLGPPSPLGQLLEDVTKEAYKVRASFGTEVPEELIYGSVSSGRMSTIRVQERLPTRETLSPPVGSFDQPGPSQSERGPFTGQPGVELEQTVLPPHSPPRRIPWDLRYHKVFPGGLYLPNGK